jgi:hypothetical protein
MRLFVNRYYPVFINVYTIWILYLLFFASFRYSPTILSEIKTVPFETINDYTTKSFKISKNDKKVLEENIYKIVTTPYENEIFCTDYVGKINISISNHNSKYSINLNSVCDWKTFNEETKNISKIIDRYK